MSSTPTLEGQKTLTINEISEQIEAGLLRPGALVEGTLGSQKVTSLSLIWMALRGAYPPMNSKDRIQGIPSRSLSKRSVR